MRGIAHKCNSESAGGPREEQTQLGPATPEDIYSTLHKCYSYPSSSAQESYTFSDGCACKATQDLLLYWTTTEGQRVRSGASSEGQRGSGHHLKDKETRRTIWRHRVGPSAVFSYKSWIGSEHSQSVRERHLGDVVATLFLWPAEGLPSGADSQRLQARRHFRLTPVSWDADIMHKK